VATAPTSARLDAALHRRLRSARRGPGGARDRRLLRRRVLCAVARPRQRRPLPAVLAFSPGFAAPRSLHGHPRVYISHGRADRVLPVERCGRRLARELAAAATPWRTRSSTVGTSSHPRCAARRFAGSSRRMPRLPPPGRRNYLGVGRARAAGCGRAGPEDRVWRSFTAEARAALEHGLSPTDLQTLLLAVARRRAGAVTAARLLRRWQEDRFVRPSAADPAAGLAGRGATVGLATAPVQRRGALAGRAARHVLRRWARRPAPGRVDRTRQRGGQ
jgi:hypothetical protein